MGVSCGWFSTIGDRRAWCPARSRSPADAGQTGGSRAIRPRAGLRAREVTPKSGCITSVPAAVPPPHAPRSTPAPRPAPGPSDARCARRFSHAHSHTTVRDRRCRGDPAPRDRRRRFIRERRESCAGTSAGVCGPACRAGLDLAGYRLSSRSALCRSGTPVRRRPPRNRRCALRIDDPAGSRGRRRGVHGMGRRPRRAHDRSWKRARLVVRADHRRRRAGRDGLARAAARSSRFGRSLPRRDRALRRATARRVHQSDVAAGRSAARSAAAVL